MLQIISGKLFTAEIGRTNTLRGVLYTNMAIFGDEPIETAAGRLIPVSNLRGNDTVICEIDEHMEGSEIAAGVIVSHGIEPFINEFSVVVSFALDVICTPNSDLARRLSGDTSSIGISLSPSRYIPRIYNKKITISDDDINHLKHFAQKLIDLPREKYLVAIRALRTYVIAIQRIGDDLELSYTLLVASIESLAQNFDGHIAEWSDYAQDKRVQIDKALSGADEEVSVRVREAILQIEHVALSRRFRSFALDYLPESFFRADALNIASPVGKADLDEALRHAYSTRSEYIHELIKLPRELTYMDRQADTIIVDNKTMLTFQGLSRVARQVITGFVHKQESMKKEPYNYSRERPGVMIMRMSPETWITDPRVVDVNNGTILLEAYLHILNQCYVDRMVKPATNIRNILTLAVSKFPNMNEQQRRPYVILLSIWNEIAREEDKVYLKPSESNIKLRDEPSVESLCAHAILGSDTLWTAATHLREYKAYYKKRETRTGLRALVELEACLGLALAERYRSSGDSSSAKLQITATVENFPSMSTLKTLEDGYTADTTIKWLDIVYPLVPPSEQVATPSCHDTLI